MPTCEKCHRTLATGEMRRRRNRPGEYVCRNHLACDRVVLALKSHERAVNLTPRNLRHIEIAYEQLTKLRDELGDSVWRAEPLDAPRQALEQLDDYFSG